MSIHALYRLASRRAAACALAAGCLLFANASATDPGATPAFRFDATAEAAADIPRLHSLLVSWNGELVLERYFNGRDAQRIANVKSVSKSVISALVGIAIARGHIKSVDQPIGDFFEDLAAETNGAAKAAITIEHLLTMQSGLETTSNRNYGAWVLSSNWVDWALDQPLERTPGTRMTYSTGNTHLLSAILSRATGMSTLEFARRTLGTPLGFHLASWPQDPQGIHFGGNDMEFTPRQMLAFGELYLNDGRAGGRQIIPADWVEASLSPRAESTREEGRFYGYGWWLRDFAGFEAPYAWGYGGQFIVLVPEIDLVVVTTSSSNPGPDRRRHTRRIYEFVEHQVIAPAARAVAAAGP